MPSHTKENYLKTIYSIEQEHRKIQLSRLSEKMGVSIPTVNNMVKRLQDKGWVVYKKYRPLELTTEGRKVAMAIIRRHRLSEMFLAEKMGFSWEYVHDIAEELEHINSQLFFDKIDELLNYPTVDPHGTPIPDQYGNISTQNYCSLYDCKEGDTVLVKAIKEETKEFLMYLNQKEIKLNTQIKINKIEAFDQSRVVSYNKKNDTTLTKEVCDRLLVSK